MLSWKSIELGLEHLLDLVRADPRMEEEFELSRKEFFVDAATLRAPLAELRHLEWFLLERPSPALGAIPAQAWGAELRASMPVAPGDLSASLLQSIPGAFEVTSLLAGEGLGSVTSSPSVSIRCVSSARPRTWRWGTSSLAASSRREQGPSLPLLPWLSSGTRLSSPQCAGTSRRCGPRAGVCCACNSSSSSISSMAPRTHWWRPTEPTMYAFVREGSCKS